MLSTTTARCPRITKLRITHRAIITRQLTTINKPFAPRSQRGHIRISAMSPPSSSSPPPQPSSTPDQTIFQLIFYTPPSHTRSILSALHSSTSAGIWPNPPSPSNNDDLATEPKYTSTAFITRGTGQFLPSATATPHIGAPGRLEVVEEDKVEMIVVGRDTVKAAVRKLREAHPYEVVAFFVVKCEDLF